MSQLGFYFNADACVGCKCCVMACKDKNDLPLGTKFRRVYDYAGGSWEVKNGACIPVDAFAYSVSTACNHCENPACVENCPTSAMHKRASDGVVCVDRNVCIACGTCERSCPYGQPVVDTDNGYSTKCDFCRSYIDNGENPACVDACVTRALLWGDLGELRQAHGDLDCIEPLPADTGTGPSTVFTASRLVAGKTAAGQVTNEQEELL